MILPFWPRCHIVVGRGVIVIRCPAKLQQLDATGNFQDPKQENELIPDQV